MLRLKAAALTLVVVAACGNTEPPAELHTAAEPQAVVAEAVARPTRMLLEATTTTLPPPAPATTTTTTVPAPPPPRAPVVSAAAASSPEKPAAGSCGGWADLVAAYFPAEQVAKACDVMGCETGHTYDPTIHNRSSSASGLFQFLDGTWRSTTGLAPPAAAYPGERQIEAAAQLWRSSGWSPWSCA